MSLCSDSMAPENNCPVREWRIAMSLWALGASENCAASLCFGCRKCTHRCLQFRKSHDRTRKPRDTLKFGSTCHFVHPCRRESIVHLVYPRAVAAGAPGIGADIENVQPRSHSNGPWHKERPSLSIRIVLSHVSLVAQTQV